MSRGKQFCAIFLLEGVSILLGIQELPTLPETSGHVCDMSGYPECTQEWDRRARVCNTHLPFVKLGNRQSPPNIPVEF